MEPVDIYSALGLDVLRMYRLRMFVYSRSIYTSFIIFFIVMSYSVFVTSLHVSQETGQLDLAESALQVYHQSRLSLYRQIKKTSINQK